METKQTQKVDNTTILNTQVKESAKAKAKVKVEAETEVKDLKNEEHEEIKKLTENENHNQNQEGLKKTESETDTEPQKNIIYVNANGEQYNIRNIYVEIQEFMIAYPDVYVEELPQDVWNHVNLGINIKDAYGLYMMKRSAILSDAKEVNQKNIESSAGAVRFGVANDYFSPTEVKEMKRGDLRRNFTKVIQSMNKWK